MESVPRNQTVFPFVAGFILLLIASAHEVASAYYGTLAGSGSSIVFGLAWLMVVAAWVEADRKKRGLSVPFEFGTLLILLWPLTLPWYLHQSRGWKGVAIFPCILLTFLFPAIIGAVAYVVLWG